MQLTAFKITNFRSIVDTGWQPLSLDNITCLIGQNESGKTSVLEALSAFYLGCITEDVLRSNMLLPKVYCKFQMGKEDIRQLLEEEGEDLAELIQDGSSVELVRGWLPDFSSFIEIGGSLGAKVLRVTAVWQDKLLAVERNIEQQNLLLKALERECMVLEEEVGSLGEQVSGFSWKGLANRLVGRREEEKSQVEKEELQELKEALGAVSEKYKQKLAELHKEKLLRNAIGEFHKIREVSRGLEERLKELGSLLQERNQLSSIMQTEAGTIATQKQWKKVLLDYKSVGEELQQVIFKKERQIYYCKFLLEGCSKSEAREKSADVMSWKASQYSLQNLGELFFSKIPEFEMFEDFGSLLPNRIDLDDVIHEREKVEGYKAACNFFAIADLDLSFFLNPSSRIMKQKIENLNDTLTKELHDFWQQYVGSHNKISINIELNHYSQSHREKAGKPYIEFWIKDERERLYPKQRSRGVCWFLSFYLELKANALASKNRKLLLIDEPGVSLHARAQQDVLKVFEDVKDQLQIVYTTHSPHLVDSNKIHRVLAVQRQEDDLNNNATEILSHTKLTTALPDTLSPLQNVMGNPVKHQGLVMDKHNVVVSDTGTFYLLSGLLKLSGKPLNLNLVPSADVKSIPLMCNILMGWGLSFSVLLFGNKGEQEMAQALRQSVFPINNGTAGKILSMPAEFLNADDIISTLDLKKHILKTREGITLPNSEYIKSQGLPRSFLFSSFLSEVSTGEQSLHLFDEETRDNVRMLMDILDAVN